MTNEELVAYWYKEILGITPEIWKRRVTEDTVQYLTECKVSQKEIAQILKKNKRDILEPDHLPDSLYEDRRIERRDLYTDWTYYVGKNYLKKGEFYYHRELMLRNPPPKIVKGREVSCTYYCEPKIRFEIDDVIDYATKQIGISHYTRNSIMAFQQMLSTLTMRYPEFESIDIVLKTIDIMAQRIEGHIIIMTELTEHINEAIEDLRYSKRNLTALGMNKIVWRSEKWRV